MTRGDFGDELGIEECSLENSLEILKDEARAEGYQQGYLDALNDIELRLGEFETTARLRKMVLSQ